MAVPRNRLSNARKNSKRAHHAKTPKNLSLCSNCQTPALSHTVCGHCGFYKGKAIAVKGNPSTT
jgi:large subunit ribosomal protein L32